jgi:hypothetical protein
MDPTANLEEQMRLAAKIIKACDRGEDPLDPMPAVITRIIAADGQRLAELVEALTGWIRRGGAFPKQWTSTNAQTENVLSELFGHKVTVIK